MLVVGLLLAVFQFVLFRHDGPAGHLIALFPLAFLVYLVAGIIAWSRRPGSQMGALIVFAGLALYLAGLVNTTEAVLVDVGIISATLVFATIIHLLHAFPSGQLRGRVSTITVVVGYVTALVLGAPSYLLDPARHRGLAVADRPEIAAMLGAVQAVVGAAAMISTAVLLVRRVVRASDSYRNTIIWLYSYGAFAVLGLIAIPNVLGPAFTMSPAIQELLQLALLTGFPIAFAWGVLKGGFAMTRELEELGIWLGAAGSSRATLAAALADTLGDSSLRLSFWLASREMFVDQDGRIVPDEVGDGERATVEVLLEGERVGAITYNAALIADAELVRAAGRVVAIAVDRDRLTAELRASQRDLQDSRERLVNAADQERKRIAQDLHDGLQVQLVLLGVQAQHLASTGSTIDCAARQARNLRRGIDEAAANLRRLAHAVMPATLTAHGLVAAVEDLVDRMPIPAAVELSDTAHLPQTVERTVYFVIAEALANTVKHANATSASVRLSRDGRALVIDVHDDGHGGASFEGGTGLRGLADRVDVLGGTMTVDSPIGSGTSLRVRLPCASS